jgi:dephospho-CoA kinase
MLKIGVTGGIGSGKSLVCRVFSTLGVPVYNADIEARRLMGQDRQLITKLSEAFGPDVLVEGKPDRKVLAGLIFNDPEAMERMNSIVHPAVRKDFISWLEKHADQPYVMKEAAILFEAGTHAGLDSVILVTAPEEVRIRRVMLRDGENEHNIRQRMANQWPDEKKMALAGLVIKNDNTRAILPVILCLHNELSRGKLPETMRRSDI